MRRLESDEYQWTDPLRVPRTPRQEKWHEIVNYAVAGSMIGIPLTGLLFRWFGLI